MASMNTLQKRSKQIAFVGLVILLTGLVATGLQGYFTILTALICMVGLVAGSAIFLPRLGKNLPLYVNTALYALFFSASLITVFLLVQRHPGSIDATRNKLYSLSGVSETFLKRLDREVRVVTFQTEADKDGAAQLLRQYADASRLFSYEVLNPFRDVARARLYGTVMPGDTFLELKTTNSATLASVVKITKLKEEDVTNGIVQLIRGKELSLYFLTGHGELELEEDASMSAINPHRPTTHNLSELKKQLEQAHIKTLALSLGMRNRVPTDASAVVIVAPKTDISSAEREALENYVQSGGKVLFFLNPELPQVGGGEIRQPQHRLTELVEQYGLSMPPDVVIAPTDAQSATDAFTIQAHPKKHRTTRDLPPAQGLIFSFARPVIITAVLPPNVIAEPVLESQPYCLRVPIDEITRAQLARQKLAVKWDPKQLATQPLAAALTVQMPGTSEEKAARMLVVGNGNFLASEVLDQNSWLFFLNTVNWATNAGDLIAIPSTQIENTSMLLTDGQKQFLFLLLVIIVPSIIGLFGIGYTLSRREHQ